MTLYRIVKPSITKRLKVTGELRFPHLVVPNPRMMRFSAHVVPRSISALTDIEAAIDQMCQDTWGHDYIEGTHRAVLEYRKITDKWEWVVRATSALTTSESLTGVQVCPLTVDRFGAPLRSSEFLSGDIVEMDFKLKAYRSVSYDSRYKRGIFARLIGLRKTEDSKDQEAYNALLESGV